MRKTALITISADGRDFGKTFVLTELSASAAEWWAFRLFLALARAGVDVPDDMQSMGFAGIAQMGYNALGGVSPEDARPLMDEMFSCVQALPDAAQPLVVRALVESDIEEIGTRLRLRKEVFKLHVDFSKLAAPSTSAAAAGESSLNT